MPAISELESCANADAAPTSTSARANTEHHSNQLASAGRATTAASPRAGSRTLSSSSLTDGDIATKAPNSNIRPPIQIQATSGRTITRKVPSLVSGLTLLMIT